MPSVGLVLSGGGARAAYQAGVISAIADLSSELKIKNPFQIYSGVSAGALNAAMLIGTPLSFQDASAELNQLWSRVNSDQVFISNPVSLSMGGVKWLAELSLGGIKRSTPGISLLNTAPLANLISENCRFDHIAQKVQNGSIQAFAISALDYYSTSTVTFVQGNKDRPLWRRVRRRAELTDIGASHILASSAIPVLFPPVKIGDSFYGDGSVRNMSPSSPAIYLGAEKIIAIGVRRHQEICYSAPSLHDSAPTLSRVINVLLHALMMDGLEIDIERIERINQNLQHLSLREIQNFNVRPVETLWMAPSRDISEMASKKAGELPNMIRYLLRGLGALKEASELSSFLLFEADYCKELMELGFEDAMKSKDNIKRFLTEEVRHPTGNLSELR